MNTKTHTTKIVILAITITVIVISFLLPNKITHIDNPISVSTTTIKNNTQENTISVFTETEALAIAQTSCIKGGGSLGGGSFHDVTKTWWFDTTLPETKQNCHPTCVVSESTQTAEINWRCTNIPAPKPTQKTSCPTIQGDESICTTLYKPVCAEVKIQCITTPCNPVPQTFSNSCVACNNPLVSSYTEGNCKN